MADEPQRARQGSGPNFGTLMQIAALVSLAAGVGYNFRQVTETQEWQKRYDNEYVRRDVQEQQLRQIEYKLETLRGEVIELKVLMRQKGKER